MKQHQWLWVAVILPLVGLIALVGRAELSRRLGPTWQIPIAGFDPRDLLHGRYLRYRFRFDWQGESTCGTAGTISADCCLCVTQSTPDRRNPAVRQVPCREVRQCEDWLRADALRPPLRYFVPEAQALDLETALRERAAAVEVQRGIGGQPAIGELYLDGLPWREALEARSTTP